MAFSKARRLSDFIAADGTIPTGKFASGTITSTHLADGTVAPADLHSSLDLTGKTVTVANATTGDNDTTAANTAFVQQEITALVDSSPDALNTLNELASALGDDANFSTTVTNSIATKLPLAGGTMTGALNMGSQNITSAGNITFGDSHTIGDDADDNLEIASSSGENIIVKSTDGIYLRTGGNTNALVLNSNQNATFAGDIKTTGLLEVASAQPRILLDRSDGSYSWNIYNGDGTGNFPISTFNIANNAGNPVITALDSGNVGIGNSSPTNDLTIGTNLGSGYVISAQTSSAYGLVLQTTESTPSANAALWVRNDDDGTVNTLFRVNNNGNVGIFGGSNLEFTTTTGNVRGYISAQENNVNGTHAAGLVIATSNGETITFKDHTNTNMIINGVGDVMIGNSVVNPASGFASQKGFGYNNGQGTVEIAVTSDVPVLQLGRNVATASGNAIIFRKSSNMYGSIGVEGGDSFVVAGNGASSAGIHMHPSQNAVVPAQGNARATTNTKDLGRSATSWRNIYLGTGIVQPDNTHTLQHSGGTDIGYKFNLGFIRGGSGSYNHVKTNLPSNGNKMMKFEFDGWQYSGSNFHESVTFYTYAPQSTPYNISYADWGTGGGIANVYYSSDSYVVIVIEAHASYTGGFLYAQCGRGHYVSDIQILATGSNSTTSGVF